MSHRLFLTLSFTDSSGRPAVSGECAYSAATVTQASGLRLRAAMTKTWGTAFAGYSVRGITLSGTDGASLSVSYRFTYDGMNRLTRALYAESGRKEHPLGLVKTEGTPDYTESMAYDLWLNPVRIRRHGITEVPATASRGTLRFGLCDDITLTYSGDRLVRADDTAPEVRFSGATDFLDGASKASEYTYDAAGNLLTDANRGIDAVTYNRLHRPETVGINGDTFGFIYDASGNLLQRTLHHPFGSLNPLGGLMPLTAGLDPGPPRV